VEAVASASSSFSWLLLDCVAQVCCVLVAAVLLSVLIYIDGGNARHAQLLSSFFFQREFDSSPHQHAVIRLSSDSDTNKE
jgi:hypothetical protein